MDSILWENMSTIYIDYCYGKFYKDRILVRSNDFKTNGKTGSNQKKIPENEHWKFFQSFLKFKILHKHKFCNLFKKSSK